MPGTLPIALQLYTIRDAFKTGVEKTLEEVARIGYAEVELAGLCGQTPDTFRRYLDQHGLRAISTHEGLESIEKDPAAVIGRAQTLGYRYVVVPWLGEEHRSPEGYRAIADRFDRAADRLGEAGLTLGYHNHAFEFERLADGSQGWDIFFGQPGRRFVSEMDVYWVQKGGDDPVAWLHKLSGRVPILHMKDMADTPERGFAEVGTGTVPLKQIAQAAADHGVRYLVVEQDSGWAVSPMESARVGFENLSRMI
jgi:sugar phosphate isomerase/epimerase